jgi:hypothetical protein
MRDRGRCPREDSPGETAQNMKEARPRSVLDGRAISQLRPTAVLLFWLIASPTAAAQEESAPPTTAWDGLVAGSAVFVFSVPEILGWHDGLGR